MITNNALMLDVLKKYQLRIDAFHVRADSILNDVFGKYPELLEFRKEYARLRNAERSLKDKKSIRNEYEKIYNQYELMLNECLEKEKIDSKLLIYESLCNICGDTGYIGDSEKRYCSCVIAAAAQDMLEGSNINNFETIENFDFSLFDDSDIVHGSMTQQQLMKMTYDNVVSWINAFPTSKKTQLLILGDVGLGKSYYLNAIAYDIVKKGFSAMMVTSFAINEAAFDEIKKSDSSALNMMRNVDLLLIDDLGSEQVLNNITCPTFFNVLNERVRRNKSTIVSSNLNPEKIEERYGSRVYSRLTDKHRTNIIVLKGKDIRQNKQKR